MKFHRWMRWAMLILIGIALFYAGWYFGLSCGTERQGDVLTGSINIASKPVGAKVYLDDDDTLKTTPCMISGISAGTHALKITYEHYQQHVDEITIYPGQITYVEWTLVPAIEKSHKIQPCPGKDCYVSEYDPADNYWSYENLYVAAIRLDERFRSYLQFDVDTIPDTAVITEAKLGLYYIETSSEVETSIGVYRVIDSWEEDSVRWISQPSCSAVPESVTSVPAWVTYRFVYWDITSLVQGWVDFSISNRGVLLMYTD